MKIACVADVHLDSAFAQFSPPVARARRRAIRDALRAAVERAQHENAEVLLVAGDLYEHERVAPDTGNFLLETFAALAPMRVFLAPGNHDWLGPQSLYQLVTWPENVHVFTSPSLEPVELADGLTLWGAAHRAPAGTRNFLSGFRSARDGVNVALFHGSERGGFPFQEEGKQQHAPFEDAEVREAGLHHAFVGHYHTPINGPSHTYPGSLEPISFREDGSGGVVIAEVAPDGSVTRERVVVTQTRVWDVEVDISSATNAHAVLELVRTELAAKSGMARVTLTGSLDPDVDLDARDIERTCDWLDAVVVRLDGLRPAYDLDAIAAEQTVRGQFVRDVREAQLDDEFKQKVIVTGLRALEGRDDLEVAL